MTEKILFVDDEINVLEAFIRELGFGYTIVTAVSGEEGLEKITKDGPFAVIVADMRMPGMDGIQFLGNVAEISPNSVRMMLTGNADLQTAISAVNEGKIFRFLTKPCPQATLKKSLDSGLEQYRLISVEKELLEKTLVGSIKMLTELLSIANPSALGRTSRVRKIVMHIVTELGLESPWKYELAAALSQIGWIFFPPHVVDKLIKQDPLTESESQMVAKYPSIGKKLLENIPRMDIIGQIIERQRNPPLSFQEPEESGDKYVVFMGSNILKTALNYDQLLSMGMSHRDALISLYGNTMEFKPQILEALQSFETHIETGKIVSVLLEDLDIGMIITEDVLDEFENLVIPAGTEVTYPILTKLFSLSHGDLLGDRVKIRVPGY